MIDIKYKSNFEVSDIDGKSIADARVQYKTGFNIADKAVAFLNGKKVTAADETGTMLKDKDSLVFKTAGNHRIAYLVGALVLALAISGGVFAYGFTNSTVTIGASTVSYNYADVSVNATSAPHWTVRGMEKGSTGTGSLFDINTANSGYPGNLSVTVMMANAGDLTAVYRNLSLSLEVRDSANNLIDINDDGVANSSDFTVLTINNGTVTFNIDQTSAKNYTVFLRNGSYICQAFSAGWTAGAGAPQLYCEVAQR
jgi:hypothetical protein